MHNLLQQNFNRGQPECSPVLRNNGKQITPLADYLIMMNVTHETLLQQLLERVVLQHSLFHAIFKLVTQAINLLLCCGQHTDLVVKVLVVA